MNFRHETIIVILKLMSQNIDVLQEKNKKCITLYVIYVRHILVSNSESIC